MTDFRRLTEEQLEILERVRLDDKFTTEPTPLLVWPMIKTLIAEVREQRHRLAKLEAENRELLAIADNTALILAGHRIAELEEQVQQLRFALAMYGDHLKSCNSSLPCQCGFAQAVELYTTAMEQTNEP